MLERHISIAVIIQLYPTHDYRERRGFFFFEHMNWVLLHPF